LGRGVRISLQVRLGKVEHEIINVKNSSEIGYPTHASHRQNFAAISIAAALSRLARARRDLPGSRNVDLVITPAAKSQRQQISSKARMI
jgi:ADP-ribosylglycohydrolase